MQKFTKSGGAIQGILLRPWIDSLPDGEYGIEIFPLDSKTRSARANNLMWAALTGELARWSKEEGHGKEIPASWWHEKLKKECLYVIGEMRRSTAKRRRAKMKDGKWAVWYEGKNPNVTSTTQLDPKEFSEYLKLAAVVAKERYGYPYDFDFLSQ